jgi:hypothetical protein
MSNQHKIHDLIALYRQSFVVWSDQAALLRKLQTVGSEAGVENAQSLTNEAEASYRATRDRLTEEMLTESGLR